VSRKNGRSNNGHRKRGRPRRGWCCRCHQYQEIGRHHVLPVRFWGKGSRAYRPITVPLCEACHQKLEKRIPLERRLHRRKYFEIILDFLELESFRLKHLERLSPEQYLIWIAPRLRDYSRDPETSLRIWEDLNHWINRKHRPIGPKKKDRPKWLDLSATLISPAQHQMVLGGVNLLILNINWPWFKFKQLSWRHQTTGLLFKVIFIKQFEARKLDRLTGNKTLISIYLSGWRSPTIHVDDNLHFRQRFDQLIIGHHRLCKTMND